MEFSVTTVMPARRRGAILRWCAWGFRTTKSNRTLCRPDCLSSTPGLNPGGGCPWRWPRANGRQRRGSKQPRTEQSRVGPVPSAQYPPSPGAWMARPSVEVIPRRKDLIWRTITAIIGRIRNYIGLRFAGAARKGRLAARAVQRMGFHIYRRHHQVRAISVRTCANQIAGAALRALDAMADAASHAR